MYKVRVITVKETEEIEVEATYCLVDERNNLVFQNGFPLVTLEPIAMFSANRWVSVRKVEIKRVVSSVGSGIPLRSQ